MILLLIVAELLLSAEAKSLYQETLEPLLITPFIEKGQIELAKQKSRVIIPGFDDIESYSGFITVDEKFNSNLFFWFFKSNKSDAPLSTWFQGGPGGSSLIGLFYEHGPFEVKNNQLHRRKYIWTDMFHMIYIDSPVGTGFSFTDSVDGYSRNQSQITENLYTFMDQFFKLFPEHRSNDLYLMGESYGCKPVVDLAFKMDSSNDSNMNLKGIAVGGGFCDPGIQSKYGRFLYDEKLISLQTLSKFETKEKQLDYYMNRGDFRKAFRVWSSFWDLIPNINAYNYKIINAADDAFEYKSIINESKFRQTIHVGNIKINDGFDVFLYLIDDFMKSVKANFPALLDKYNVLLFNGNLDVITAAPLVDKLIDSIEWQNSTHYKTVPQEEMIFGSQVVGYSKRCHKFTRGVIFEAGHLTPHDQPQANYEVIKNFINS